jgi:hypothetical protein
MGKSKFSEKHQYSRSHFMFLTLLTPTQTHSDGFLAENNREEWLWKCRRRQWDLYPEDRDKIKRLVTPWRECTEAEFENKIRMPAAMAALGGGSSSNFHRARAGPGGYGT